MVAECQARRVAGGANMAMWGVVEDMASAGVACTCVAYHAELQYGGRGDELHYDSCGIWLLGPADRECLRILTPIKRAGLGALIHREGARAPPGAIARAGRQDSGAGMSKMCSAPHPHGACHPATCISGGSPYKVQRGLPAGPCGRSGGTLPKS